MRTRGWNVEDREWQTRSLLEGGGPLPLSTGGAEYQGRSARGLAQPKTWRLCFCFLLSALCFRASGQFAIDWSTIDGGGGTSTGGVYAVSGTIGQPDASQQTMTGGNYSLTGGFWALYAVQTPGAPTLTIVPDTPGNAKISWTPNNTNYVLQENLDIATTNWVFSPSGSTNPIVVPTTLPTKFYRLLKP
jgi:hypothetical protein